MEVQTVPIDSVHEDPANVRKHPERNLAAIKASLARFGLQKPIVVDENGVVRAGNGTLLAARALGWKEIAVVRTPLKAAEATAFAIADNRTSDLSVFDHDDLAKTLRALLDDETAGITLPDMGFDDADLRAILDGDPLPEVGVPPGKSVQEELAGIQEDEPVEPPAREAATTKPGDLYLLGSHRLLCGDSTKPEDVARVMAGEKAKLLATDPPYGVDYSKVKDGIPWSGFRTMQEDWGDLQNDDLEGKALQEFLEKVFRAAVPHLDRAAWYLWHACLTEGFFAAAAAAAAADVFLHRQIIWKKAHLVLTRSGMYHWQHEPCFYGWIRGLQPAWHGERNQTSVWEIPHDPRNERVHQTQKPVRLFAIPILNHLLTGEVCYEPFAGSGSQLIAAEHLGRRCCAIEIEPRFCDAIVKRWETLTGRKATLA